MSVQDILNLHHPNEIYLSSREILNILDHLRLEPDEGFMDSEEQQIYELQRRDTVHWAFDSNGIPEE